VSFVKVAEFQRRGVVHFHALVRLDVPDDFTPPTLTVAAADVAHAVRQAAGSVRLMAEVPAGSPLQPEPRRRHSEAQNHKAEPEHSTEAGVAHREKQEAGRQKQIAYPQEAGASERDGLEGSAHQEGLPHPRGLLLRFGEQVDVQVGGGGAALS
jgi:hypothetical protein